jgi:Flp pilus assembly protein TadG
MKVFRNAGMPRQHSSSLPERIGVATVELAVCLPLAVTLVVGMIEASNAIFTKQSIKIATYEAARIATATGRTESQAIQRATEVLTSRGITKVSIQVSPRVTAKTPRGTPVTVTIQMEARDASFAGDWFSKRAKFAASVQMVRL